MFILEYGGVFVMGMVALSLYCSSNPIKFKKIKRIILNHIYLDMQNIIRKLISKFQLALIKCKYDYVRMRYRAKVKNVELKEVLLYNS